MKAAALLAAFCFSGLAQTAPIAFEVATIKPSEPGVVASPTRNSGMRITGDRVEIRDFDLRFSLGQAYRVRPIYVFGENWITTAKFDISAKIPEGATAAQVPEMLQALFTERFGVRMHRETRQMPVFVLKVAKGGFKLKELPPDTPNSSRNSSGSMVMVGTLEAIGAAGSFAGSRNPLVDQTGLTGKYEIALDPALIFAGLANRDPLDDSDALARMQEAVAPLGLTIERGRVPEEVVVIDHIEHTPTGN